MKLRRYRLKYISLLGFGCGVYKHDALYWVLHPFQMVHKRFFEKNPHFRCKCKFQWCEKLS